MVGHPAYAWYVIPLVGVASIATTPRVGAMTLALCASALFANVLEGIATSFIALPQGYLFALFWRVLLWSVPPLLALLWVERASRLSYYVSDKPMPSEPLTSRKSQRRKMGLPF